MTTADYITTTGERWFVDGTNRVCESGSPMRLLNATAILAELRALRAQRDELQGQLQCAGIISDHAIKLDDDRQTWKHKARDLEKQRDDLLAALESAADCLGAVEDDSPHVAIESLAAREVLDRIKGEA